MLLWSPTLSKLCKDKMACSNTTEQGEDDTRESEIGPSLSRALSITGFIMLPVINQSSGLCCAPASLMAMCKSSAYCLYPYAVINIV